MISIRTKNSVMNEIYQRILQNKPFDKNLKPYTREKLISTLLYFENIEEYEKCQSISGFIQNRFNHSVNFKIKKGS